MDGAPERYGDETKETHGFATRHRYGCLIAINVAV
jgi:hypothetical protein